MDEVSIPFNNGSTFQHSPAQAALGAYARLNPLQQRVNVPTMRRPLSGVKNFCLNPLQQRVNVPTKKRIKKMRLTKKVSIPFNNGSTFQHGSWR